ncbi:hypothetical protein HOV43_gp211 [Escherichia phage vB_EcoM_KWBSE43-6]|uniref:Uncharacterized protein n=1 Tax=Escherichia phage vB_EcoM_KWBSE43-6 TaxID=2508194 RepID=A0A482N0G6_9CAUD|nr:hypothetical protein HOV43_gp211 [Escherichia phage vB_EcoM_KWBSE43-6]QBQ78972.1 hypothetical protein KWBSE43_00152 [Escherichia phage vB_EcoM_KWBSE43-6]
MGKQEILIKIKKNKPDPCIYTFNEDGKVIASGGNFNIDALHSPVKLSEEILIAATVYSNLRLHIEQLEAVLKENGIVVQIEK